MRSDWNFDTVRTVSAMGTIRSMAQDLQMPNGMVPDIDEESEFEENIPSIDTGAATKGSDGLPHGIGSNLQASHSTVVIKPLEKAAPFGKEIHEEEDDTPPGTLETAIVFIFSVLTDVFDIGAPPAYTGSIRTTRRSSYAARTSVDGTGTVLSAADIGNGVDTIRPVKKVDPVGSLRLSSEFVGSLRKEAGPTSPTSSSIRKRKNSEFSRAGVSMVDQVILPIIQKVGVFFVLMGAMIP